MASITDSLYVSLPEPIELPVPVEQQASEPTYASNVPLKDDPRVAPMTADTPRPRIHAGTAAVLDTGNDSTYVDHGTDSASLAFHGGAQHKLPVGQHAEPGRERIDPDPVADIRNSKAIKPDQRLLPGDVLVIARDNNHNGRIDEKNEILDVAVVVAIDAQGRAVRLAAKTQDSDKKTIDFHPAQLPSRPGEIHKWVRPNEKPGEAVIRANFVAGQLRQPVETGAIDRHRFPPVETDTY
jgi:hypothetical protein